MEKMPELNPDEVELIIPKPEMNLDAMTPKFTIPESERIERRKKGETDEEMDREEELATNRIAQARNKQQKAA